MQTTNHKLLLVQMAPQAKWKVGDLFNVRVGAAVLQARILEDRGAMGPSGTEVVAVEIVGDPSGDVQRFEVPVAAILKLKPRGLGNAGSANVAVARAAASRNANVWVLRELDASERPTFDRAFDDLAKLEAELLRRGLTRSQVLRLMDGQPVALAS